MSLPKVVNQLDSAHVISSLGKLDEIHQAAVALFYLEDFSYREIAAVLEIPIGTVKSRLSRGIQQLRELLLADGHTRSTGDAAEPQLESVVGSRTIGDDLNRTSAAR